MHGLLCAVQPAADRRRMKITAVESLILLERFHLIHTDEQVAGIGAVSPMNAHVTDAFVQKALAPLIVGRNPSTYLGAPGTGTSGGPVTGQPDGVHRRRRTCSQGSPWFHAS